MGAKVVFAVKVLESKSKKIENNHVVGANAPRKKSHVQPWKLHQQPGHR
jgi:hypothetical protein